MELNTASSVISKISKIEQESADFYEDWAGRYEELRKAFLLFSKENKKNEKTIKRSYYNVVSDALETNFCFKDLEDNVSLPNLKYDIEVSEVLRASIDLEESIKCFYLEASKLSKALLADVPRALERVARLRKARLEGLRLMLNNV
jgi:hypothetical protein